MGSLMPGGLPLATGPVALSA